MNLMPVQPTAGGTLHVTGEVNTHSTDFAFLQKRVPQGISPKILLLDLLVFTGIKPEKNPQWVRYNEALETKDQYSSIEIYYDNEREACIAEIKEVH